MKVIISHDNTDFDGFAAAFAVRKLHPDHEVILNRRISKSVRDFLALHRDIFPVRRAQILRQNDVDEVIVVDVRRASRLVGDFPTLVHRIKDPEDDILVSIYDHHGPSDDDLPASLEVLADVGAVTTLVVEQLRERSVDLEPMEATLFALGIHMDTGSLTFANSTPRDARALGWVMERGANLRVINEFLSPPLSALQRDTLARTLENLRAVSVNGVSVGLAVVPCEKAVPELGMLVSQVADLEEHAAVFGIYPTKNRTFVIGRSAVDYIDVGAILRELGGGGHPRAAAATLKRVETETLVQNLEDLLQAQPIEAVTVTRIMSSPVISVDPTAPLLEVEQLCHEHEITGVPVLNEEGELLGMISRRDIDRARRDDRVDLNVNSCMSHVVQTVPYTSTIEDALFRMVQHNVGRLPVIRHNEMIGIVTRSDIIEVLYGTDIV